VGTRVHFCSLATDSPMTDPRPDNRAAKRFTGSLLMAGGGLVAVLCGLCTLGVGATGFVGMSETGPTSANVGGALLMVLMAAGIGGIPTLIGAWIFWIGRKMYREGAAPNPPT